MDIMKSISISVYFLNICIRSDIQPYSHFNNRSISDELLSDSDNNRFRISYKWFQFEDPIFVKNPFITRIRIQIRSKIDFGKKLQL